MFLSDADIELLLREGKLMKNWTVDSITPNGYDLRIDEVNVNGSVTYIVPPKTHFLVSTVEYLTMPNDLVGFLWLRSRWSRRGVIGSFGVVDAGYEGTLTLSAYNSSNVEISLERGVGFVQIVFGKLTREAEKSYPKRTGNYHKSVGIKI